VSERAIEKRSRSRLPARLPAIFLRMVSHEPAVLPAALLSLVASEGRLYMHIHVYITSRNADFICRYSLTSPPNADNHLCNHHCGICAYPRGCARAPTAKLIRTFLIAALCIHLYHQPPLQALAVESLLCQLQHGITCRFIKVVSINWYADCVLGMRPDLENLLPHRLPFTW
jgi:hypothetical protein